MTREEAIKHFEEWKECISSAYRRQVIDMAIEALHREEAEEKGWCHRIRPKNVEVVVRCKDCIQKHIGGSVTQYYWCDLWDRETDCNNGCSWGERKGGEDNGNG